MRVLIVDDSVVVRSAIRAALEGDARIEVVGSASNGKIALEMAQQKSVDVITLDLEMPVLDGIGTLKALRSLRHPARVIVFSALTTRGSERTLEALSHGAQDFVTKPKAESPEAATAQIRIDLLPKILQFAAAIPVAAPPARPLPRRDLELIRPLAVVIASSTGGPAALEGIFRGLQGRPRVPILIAQHMPPVFTRTLAKRLGDLSGLPTKEAEQGEYAQPGVYLAPGDFHLSVAGPASAPHLKLDQGPLRNSLRPAADPLFESAAALWGPQLLGCVLTGMGEDGLVGSRAVKAGGGAVAIQTAASCVVYGMPGAVAAAGLEDASLDLEGFQTLLRKVAIQ